MNDKSALEAYVSAFPVSVSVMCVCICGWPLEVTTPPTPYRLLPTPPSLVGVVGLVDCIQHVAAICCKLSHTRTLPHWHTLAHTYTHTHTQPHWHSTHTVTKRSLAKGWWGCHCIWWARVATSALLLHLITRVCAPKFTLSRQRNRETEKPEEEGEGGEWEGEGESETETKDTLFCMRDRERERESVKCCTCNVWPEVCLFDFIKHATPALSKLYRLFPPIFPIFLHINWN